MCSHQSVGCDARQLIGANVDFFVVWLDGGVWRIGTSALATGVLARAASFLDGRSVNAAGGAVLRVVVVVVAVAATGRGGRWRRGHVLAFAARLARLAESFGERIVVDLQAGDAIVLRE